MTTRTLLILGFVLLVSCTSRFISAVKPRQWILLAVSYYAYSSLAGYGFLALLIASSLMNYFWGSLLRRRPAVALLVAGLVSNVLLLAFFKYLPPLARMWPGPFSELDFVQRILLPLGVSFWTFQAISYLLDTYLEEEMDPSVVEFCLYMAFWPTVVSGPVCRLTRMLPQFRSLPTSVREDYSLGVVRLIQGLFMRFVLAELLATGVSPGGGVAAGFDSSGIQRSALDVWALAIGFGFQLYFDFAGYSNIVIGAARLAGIRLEENFNRPYLSTTPAQFWTRWHMSLSFWIRDYVYTPLATLRRDQWWRYAALVISMVIFGFWHDAKLTMLLWGTYHGLVLVGHRVGQQLSRRIPFNLPNPLALFLSWGATFALMCLAYVPFRANDLAQASQLLASVVSPTAYRLSQATLHPDYLFLVGLIVAGYFAYVGLTRLVELWTEHYHGELLRRTASGTNISGIVLRTSHAVAIRKWWVLTPVLMFMLVTAGLGLFGKGSSTAPFMYMLF
jgi:alginate O-acetyltransferase complex protein AlgI